MIRRLLLVDDDPALTAVLAALGVCGVPAPKMLYLLAYYRPTVVLDGHDTPEHHVGVLLKLSVARRY